MTAVEALRRIAYPPDGIPRPGTALDDGNCGPYEHLHWPEPRTLARAVLKELGVMTDDGGVRCHAEADDLHRP